MNSKAAKKLRQLHRKEVRDSAREVGSIIGNVMKPKPKWVPWRLWLFGLGFFIKINRKKK